MDLRKDNLVLNNKLQLADDKLEQLSPTVIEMAAKFYDIDLELASLDNDNVSRDNIVNNIAKQLKP